MIDQERIEGAHQSAQSIAGRWERSRRHKHDTCVPVEIWQAPRSKSHEVADVLGDNDAPLPGRRDEDLDILPATQVPSFRDSHDVMAAAAKRLGQIWRQVLVEEQLHPSASATLRCLASSSS